MKILYSMYISVHFPSKTETGDRKTSHQSGNAGSEFRFIFQHRQKTGFEIIQKSIANKHTSIPKTMSYEGKLNYRLKTDNNTAN